MRSVKIKTKELLEILRGNLAQHILEFNEAYDSYVEVATKELEEAAKLARASGEISRNPIKVVEPRSHETSYNTIIRMLELSDDKVVELSQQEFSQYVEDKWTWSEDFFITNTLYKTLKSN